MHILILKILSDKSPYFSKLHKIYKISLPYCNLLLIFLYHTNKLYPIYPVSHQKIVSDNNGLR